MSALQMSTSLAIAVLLFSLSADAFAPRAFLKREDPAMAKANDVEASEEKPASGPAQTQQKRFDLGDALYGAPAQMKRFDMFDGFYEQPWAQQHKRFDYLDGYYGAPAGAAGFYPFYGGPAKRFDFGFAPRGRPLSGFL